MTNGQDIAEALAGALSVIPDVRVYSWMPDTFQAPGIVVQQPTVSWSTDQRTFCSVLWEFPLAVVVLRNQDREAQVALYSLLEAIADVLDERGGLDGLVQTARLTNATPATINTGGRDLPAYLCTVEITA